MKNNKLIFLLLCLQAVSCMKYGPVEEELFDEAGASGGVFVSCEGNFMYGNASLSFYNPMQKAISQDVFSRANAISLGDVAQSMTLYKNSLFLVVNNSGVVFSINPFTFKVNGIRSGLVSPRNLLVINPRCAYISDLYSGALTLVDPMTMEVTGSIPTPGHASTEEMLSYKESVFVSCWSYDNKILIVDTLMKRVVDSIQVGWQPKDMVMDKYNKIWVLTQGRANAALAGDAAPMIFKIDAAKREVEWSAFLPFSDTPTGLCMNRAQDTLFYINRHVWRMPVVSTHLPQEPFLSNNQTRYYALGVEPSVRSEIYVADALDYVQSGVVERFNSQGQILDSFRTGIIPGAFCFIQPQ